MRSLVCLFVIGLASAKHEAYDGYSVYQVSVKTSDQVQPVNHLETSLDLDVWSHAIPGRPGQVLVAGDKKQLFEDGLNGLGVEFKIEAENIKEFLELEDKLLAEASNRSRAEGSRVALTFDRIYTYEEINDFLEDLAEAYPDTVTLVNAGQSFEGRDIKYIKISTTNFQIPKLHRSGNKDATFTVQLKNVTKTQVLSSTSSLYGCKTWKQNASTELKDVSKPVVFMESLLHAREWVTLPATLYAIHKLVIDVTEQDIDWIILPIANPDGYAFTHSENRFWRKNRATGYMINDVCLGVDLNRNFDVFWSQASSSLVCWDTFHGRAPFSEPETSIVRDIFEEHKDRIELFLDIHSFGSMILYGFGTGELPANGLFVHLVGVQMAQSIDAVKLSFNPDYIVGNVALVLYQASGSASDYAKAAGVPFAYTYELPGHRYGLGTALGFLVDPEFIEQAGFETWEGIKAGARYARNSFNSRANKTL